MLIFVINNRFEKNTVPNSLPSTPLLHSTELGIHVNPQKTFIITKRNHTNKLHDSTLGINFSSKLNDVIFSRSRTYIDTKFMAAYFATLFVFYKRQNCGRSTKKKN